MEAWSKYSSGRISESPVKILSQLCRPFGICPYAANQSNRQIEVNQPWKVHSLIFAGMFLLLSVFLVFHEYFVYGLIPRESFFLCVFATLTAEALSYSFAGLYHGQSVARAMTTLWNLYIPSSENHKIMMICLVQCCLTLFTIGLVINRTLCHSFFAKADENFLKCSLVVWGIVQVLMSSLGEMQFTTFVLILTARMTKLASEIRRGGNHLLKTYKQMLDTAAILNTAFNSSLLIAVFTVFLNEIFCLYAIITKGFIVYCGVIRIIFVFIFILKLWMLIYACDSAHVAVSNLLFTLGYLKVAFFTSL